MSATSNRGSEFTLSRVPAQGCTQRIAAPVAHIGMKLKGLQTARAESKPEA
jgi:hypothetical protein